MLDWLVQEYEAASKNMERYLKENDDINYSYYQGRRNAILDVMSRIGERIQDRPGEV